MARHARRGAAIVLSFGLIVGLVAGDAEIISAATTTVQVAAGATAPHSGLIINGAANNPATGKPWRHIWYGDFANGLCRIDPDVDTMNANIAAGLPAGGHLNVGTCMHFIANFAQFKPGQLSLDPRPSPVEAARSRTLVNMTVPERASA
jgi:hypothetical protein